MTIKQITIDDLSQLEQFFVDANTSDTHRTDTFKMIKHYLSTDCYYRGFAYFRNDQILSCCFMRELTEQKAQILDFIVTKKDTNIFKNKVDKVVDCAIEFGERKGIYRFYTFLTDDMLDTVDHIKKKSSLFSWRQRYDTYIDEVIEPNTFSIHRIHWVYLMNSTVRSQKRNVRHHHLKQSYLASLE
jgi:hypothetical protein